MLAPASRAAVRAVAPRGLQQPVRQSSRAVYADLVVSPPTVRISLPEKIGHAVLLTIGVLGYPFYTMARVAKIKEAEYANLEIPDVKFQVD